MTWPANGLFRESSILALVTMLVTKYEWYRKLGWSRGEAARKARWRAGLKPPARGSGSDPESGTPSENAKSRGP